MKTAKATLIVLGTILGVIMAIFIVDIIYESVVKIRRNNKENAEFYNRVRKERVMEEIIGTVVTVQGSGIYSGVILTDESKREYKHSRLEDGYKLKVVSIDYESGMATVTDTVQHTTGVLSFKDIAEMRSLKE